MANEHIERLEEALEALRQRRREAVRITHKMVADSNDPDVWLSGLRSLPNFQQMIDAVEAAIEDERSAPSQPGVDKMVERYTTKELKGIL